MAILLTTLGTKLIFTVATCAAILYGTFFGVSTLDEDSEIEK